MWLAGTREEDEDQAVHLSGLLWVGIGTVVIALAIVLLFFRGSSPPDLGTVSGQWIAQHRASSDWLFAEVLLGTAHIKTSRSTEAALAGLGTGPLPVSARFTVVPRVRGSPTQHAERQNDHGGNQREKTEDDVGHHEDREQFLVRLTPLSEGSADRWSAMWAIVSIGHAGRLLLAQCPMFRRSPEASAVADGSVNKG